jgi:hypothetical protein
MRHKRRAYSLSLQTIAQTYRVRVCSYAEANLIEQIELGLPHDRNLAHLPEDLVHSSGRLQSVGMCLTRSR